MEWLVWLVPPVTVVCWLIGGQINKAVRRFGIPGWAMITAYVQFIKVHKEMDKKNTNKEDKAPKWYAYLPMLLFMAILSMGYGVNSTLMKFVRWVTKSKEHRKNDLIVRILYGIILAIPFGIMTPLLNKPWWYPVIMIILLPGAFSIRAGAFKIGEFEVLWEDVARSSAFSVGLVMYLV